MSSGVEEEAFVIDANFGLDEVSSPKDVAMFAMSRCAEPEVG